jgi:WD40 repeat protein
VVHSFVTFGADGMTWPLSQDYNEAVQNAASCFGDPDLKRGEVTLSPLGLPIPRSGNFADVYRVKAPDGRFWAVKCFTRRVNGLQERYTRIDAHLRSANLPFTVGFSYLPEGIRVRGQWYPLVKMEWVEGFTLNEFVRENLDKPAHLEALLKIWVRLARRLRDARITHADLQHGNVLLVPGSSPAKLGLKLIDYDGMWIPALANQPSGEIGHPAYQHPARIREKLYSAEADRFPYLVVATALRALVVGGRELWKRFDNGDNMLFREEDLKKPAGSPLVKTLWNARDPVLTALLGPLVLAVDRPLIETPWLDHLLEEGRAPNLSDTDEAKVAGTLGIEARPARGRLAAGRPAPVNSGTGDNDFAAIADSSADRPLWRRKRRWLPVALAGTAAVAVVGVCIALAVRGDKPNNTNPPAVTQKNLEDEKAGPEPSPPPEQKQPEPPEKKAPELPRRILPKTKPLPGISAEGPPGPLRSFTPQNDQVWAAAFLPSGRQAITIEGNTARLWNLADGRVLKTFPHDDLLFGLAVSPDGKYFVTGGQDKSVRVWSLTSDKPLHEFKGLDSAVWGCAVSADSARVAAVTSRGTIQEWELESGEETNTIKGPEGGCLCIAYSPDAKLVAIGRRDKIAEVWNLQSRKAVVTFDKHDGPVNAIRFSPDGLYVFSASDDKSVQQWETATGNQVRKFADHTDKVVSLDLSQDGSLLAAGAADGRLRVWDVDSGKQLTEFQRPGEVRGLALARDGRRLLTGHGNKLLQLYRLPKFENGRQVADASDFALVWKMRGGAAPNCLQFLPDAGRFVLSPGSPPELRWYKIGSGDTSGELIGTATRAGDEPIQALSVTPGGDVISLTANSQPILWDSEKHEEKLRFNVRPLLALPFSVAPNGSAALLPGENGLVRSFSPETGKQTATPKLHGKERVIAVRHSNDGEEVVSIDQSGAIVIWSPTGEELVRFTDTARTSRSVVLSPDRQLVLGYGIGEAMTLYDSTNGKELHTLRGHTQSVLDAEFTPDGRYIVSVGMDRTFRLWEASTGKPIAEEPLPDIGTNVKVSPDGTYLLTSAGTGEHGEVHLWRLPRLDKVSD